MANLTEWIYRIIIYYWGIALVIILFSLAGAFDDASMTAQTNYAGFSGAGVMNDTITINDAAADAPSVKTVVQDLFSFSIFNISIYGDGLLVDYLWVVRFFLVWLPGMFLAILIAMYLRGVA